jgi:hypothetical protein
MSIEEQGFLSPDIAAYIATHRAENQAWFGHAMDLNSIAQQLLLEFQMKDNQTLWAALFFVRGLSSFQAAILLAERGMVQDARTIVRSCFETVFCFGALHKDPGFLEQFEKHDVYGKSAFANALPAGKLEPDAAEILSQFLAGLARSGEKGERLRWDRVADLAGLRDIYSVYYRGLSLDAAHPSHTALKRYYNINGNNVELRWGPKALDEKDIEETLIASCAACWHLVDWMVRRVDHPEINQK